MTVDHNGLTWLEGLNKFIEYASTQGSDYELSPNSIKTYNYQLRMFGKNIPLKLLKDIIQEDIVSYIQQMRRNHKKESSIHVTVSALRAAFRFWKELGYSGNPIENYHFRISSRRGRRKVRNYRKTKALSTEELKALFQAVDTEIARFDKSKQIHKEQLRKLLRIWLIFGILYTTGIRKDELLQITPEKINYENRYFFVIEKGHTEPTQKVIIELLQFIYTNEENKYPDILDRVREYIAYLDLQDKDRLFDIHERTVGRYVKRWAKKAQIVERVYPHRFRHTFGSHLGALNLSEIIIQNLMGHKDPNTTRIYVKTVPDQDVNVLQQLGLFKGSDTKEDKTEEKTDEIL